ncbi:zinc finger CCCH domain-containing protein 11-like protein [Tanacetum coccineum]
MKKNSNSKIPLCSSSKFGSSKGVEKGSNQLVSCDDCCKEDGKENESKSSGMTSNNFRSKVLDELREEKVESIGMKSKELVELDDKNIVKSLMEGRYEMKSSTLVEMSTVVVKTKASDTNVQDDKAYHISKYQDVAKKQNVVEDKTFGLKSKNKSKNVQKYVQQIQQSVVPKHDPYELAAKKTKDEEKEREKELNDLFKIVVVQPEVPPSVDPKSTVRVFQGWSMCERFQIISRRWRKWRKDNMVCTGCVQMVIKSVIIDMILLPGYILKSQMKALLEEEANKLAIEDEIEDQCAKVKITTPMTTDLFMGWKKKKMDEKKAVRASQRAERTKNDRMSGHELFLTDASLFVDDAEVYEKYHKEKPDNNNQEAQESSSMSGPSTSTSVAVIYEEGNSNINDGKLYHLRR